MAGGAVIAADSWINPPPVVREYRDLRNKTWAARQALLESPDCQTISGSGERQPVLICDPNNPLVTDYKKANETANEFYESRVPDYYPERYLGLLISLMGAVAMMGSAAIISSGIRLKRNFPSKAV